MFWDRVLLRLHFAFAGRPDRCELVGRVMATARLHRLFTLHGGDPRPLPRLSAVSLWILAGDAYRSGHGELNRLARAYLPEVSGRTPGRADVDALPGEPTRATPVDAPGRVAEARVGTPAVEAAALAAVEADYCPRMLAFRTRVSWQRPDDPELVRGVRDDFALLWLQYMRGARRPDTFPLAWFYHDVVACLQRWPPPPAYFSWATRPVWIDGPEWDFLHHCHSPAVPPPARLALFLLVYGGLNVREIACLFGSLNSDRSLTLPLDEGGLAGHLVNSWVVAVREMARIGSERTTAG